MSMKAGLVNLYFHPFSTCNLSFQVMPVHPSQTFFRDLREVGVSSLLLLCLWYNCLSLQSAVTLYHVFEDSSGAMQTKKIGEKPLLQSMLDSGVSCWLHFTHRSHFSFYLHIHIIILRNETFTACPYYKFFFIFSLIIHT